MKKLLLISLLIITAAFLFTGCGDENDTPDGMQLIEGGDGKGYYFFAPEEWTKGTTMDGLAYTYASRTDRTSVSFFEIDPKSFVKPDPNKSDEEFFLTEYFNSLKAEFPADSKPNFTTNGENCLLGSGDTKADKAVKYIFDYLRTDPYSNEQRRWAFTQILAVHDGRYYILTCAGSLDERSGDQTYFDYHLERFQSVIDNFRFVENRGENEEKTEYTKDADGDILVSDKKLAEFTLYAPSDFELDYSSAIVSASHSDGSNITMTKATATGTTIKQYWQFRRDALDQYVDNITDIGENPRAIEFSNANNAALCEYTYEYNGKTFRVYQIYCVSGKVIKNGYIFTYTALEENYEKHFSDIERILKKVQF